MCVREFVVIVGRLIIIRIKMAVINCPARTLLRMQKMSGKMSRGRAVVSSCLKSPPPISNHTSLLQTVALVCKALVLCYGRGICGRYVQSTSSSSDSCRSLSQEIMAVPILTVSAAGGGVLGWLVVRTVGGVVGCLARWRSILSSNACFRSRNCYVKKVSWRQWQVEKSRFIITPQDEHRIYGILPHPVGAATPLHQPFVCFQKGLQLQPERLTRMTSPACLGAQVSEKNGEFKFSAGEQ